MEGRQSEASQFIWPIDLCLTVTAYGVLVMDY